MPPQRQQGFTLIEVVVAFAIFALAMAALYESFAGASRRVTQTHDRAQALLTAQSLLSRVRASPVPWEPEQSGRLADGGFWRIDVAPFAVSMGEISPWRAFAVTVHVARDEAGMKEVLLRSVELARVPRGTRATP